MSSQPDATMSSRERIARAQNALNQPVVCPDCGSTWFFEVIFQQYSKAVYSSSPGGDLKTISVMPQQIRMCGCGRPITPNLGGTRGGRTPNAEMSSFFEGLQAALNYRNQVASGTKAVNAVTGQMASQNDLKDMTAQIAALKAELEARLTASEAALRNFLTTSAEAPTPVQAPAPRSVRRAPAAVGVPAPAVTAEAATTEAATAEAGEQPAAEQGPAAKKGRGKA